MTESPRTAPPSDHWSEWLLRHRYGGDPAYQEVAEKRILEFADAVLGHAELSPGDSLLDVGAGDGLVAFRALERLQGCLTVTLNDVSGALLEHAREAARTRAYASQCRFVHGSAEHLAGLEDSSMDAAVARASIAYVKDKPAAFRAIYRVLKPGGRFSIAEPILQEEAFGARILRQRRDSAEAANDPFIEIMHLWKSAQYPDTEEGYAQNPLVNFSERDLLAHARAAGFRPLHLRLHIDVVPALISSWSVFLASSPHPLAPTLAEILRSRFSEQQRQTFERLIRPSVESPMNLDVIRVAYLFGRKPD